MLNYTNYILRRLCKDFIITEDTLDQGYKWLFLNNYHIINKINHVSPLDKYKRIPRGAIENDGIVPTVPKKRYAAPKCLLWKEFYHEYYPLPLKIVWDTETLMKRVQEELERH